MRVYCIRISLYKFLDFDIFGSNHATIWRVDVLKLENFRHFLFIKGSKLNIFTFINLSKANRVINLIFIVRGFSYRKNIISGFFDTIRRVFITLGLRRFLLITLFRFFYLLIWGKTETCSTHILFNFNYRFYLEYLSQLNHTLQFFSSRAKQC